MSSEPTPPVRQVKVQVPMSDGVLAERTIVVSEEQYQKIIDKVVDRLSLENPTPDTVPENFDAPQEVCGRRMQVLRYDSTPPALEWANCTREQGHPGQCWVRTDAKPRKGKS